MEKKLKVGDKIWAIQHEYIMPIFASVCAARTYTINKKTIVELWEDRAAFDEGVVSILSGGKGRRDVAKLECIFFKKRDAQEFFKKNKMKEQNKIALKEMNSAFYAFRDRVINSTKTQ